MQEQHQGGQCSTCIYDPNEAWSPLARVDHLREDKTGEIFWFSTDLNGAPLEVTDEEGSLRWSGQYGSFGEVRHQTDGFTRLAQDTAMAHQPLRYAGQYADSETGLHYNLFRYYDPQTGRFIVQDPIGLSGGWNLYQYAPNPLGWIDALGLTLTKLQEMVREVHSLLDEYAQDRKTTAIGVDSSGNYHLASSERVVPPVQRVWAKENNVNVIRGDGHAEETIRKMSPTLSI
ncbi:UNVERIFIED_ORG: RHS repeat-associated protein [Atlantibacter sp. SORGH_AS 304]|nr:RHS repeat-associated protein [Atlantibacter sp. SORGH_AS_0304]